jgi:two-component system LytT family sensor kinase
VAYGPGSGTNGLRRPGLLTILPRSGTSSSMSIAAINPVFAPTRQSRRRPAVVALVWLVVALVFTTQNYLGVVTRHEQPDWLIVAGFEFEYWLTFAAASPFFDAMARRFPIGQGGTARSLAAHLAGGVLFALVQPVAADLLQAATVSWSSTHAADRLLAGMVARYPVLSVIALWKYVVIIGVYHAVNYHRTYREQEARAAQLRMQLASAQMDALRMQLQPHFLCNALNAVGALLVSTPERAHDMLAALGDLLRETMDAGTEAEVPMTRELAFLDRYLGIERVRFEERLAVQYQLPEALENALVPSLILQPLVENVIHHVVACRASPQTLIVRAIAEGDLLHLEVEDDGPGLPVDWVFAGHARGGLMNVQARADVANAIPRPLTFSSNDRGLCVRVTLPLRYPAGGARR